MSKREILAGATDQTIDVFIQDSSSSVGAGLTGLVHNTASLVCYYRKGATGTPTALSLVTQTVGGAHADGGFVAVDGTNCPGQYRLDLSDTIVATAGMVTIYLRGATNMAPCIAEIEVVSVNKFDAVRGGMTALPNAAADAAGGLPISDAGGLDIDAKLANTNEITVARMGALTDWIDGGRLDVILDARAAQSDLNTLLSRLSSARAGYLDNLNVGGLVAASAEVTGLTVNTRANLLVPIEIETPDASTQVYKIRLHLYDEQGNMEAPDSTPTVTLVNAAGTDRSSRLSSASNPATGSYTWDYTATAGDAEEQLVWVFTVVEGSLTRTYPATSYVVEESAYRFSSSDRAKLDAVKAVTDGQGATGSGLTAIPWNAAWDAEVQSEVADALIVYDGLVPADLPIAVNVTHIRGTASAGDAGYVGTDQNKITNPTATVNLSGTTVKLASDGLDNVLIEDGISPSASLTNDTGTQLTSINARQALSLAMSAMAGVLSGILTNLPLFKPGGKSSGNTRISASQSSDGRTSVTLKVPD